MSAPTVRGPPSAARDGKPVVDLGIAVRRVAGQAQWVVVKAFVIPAACYDPSDELAQQIKSYVPDTHSADAYPRKAEFMTELPKTLTGKIRRIELRQQEMRSVP